MHEIKARDGKVLAISDVDIPHVDWQIKVPSICPELMPILSAVV